MHENIITSVVRNQQVANFQQLMVMRGKGFVNNHIPRDSKRRFCSINVFGVPWKILLMIF
jgi:hypothetical protein